ncbi:TetR/AcrR family transcriptional regulator [Myxococcus sp. XM-1-1-1]|nr:TetR/AcrR family transcriptional regulator [Myxococcus sp. XM-1-1-1]MBZ4413506.1 TetR/AcrR family transcriptional regulator [Myxococcus sp. XM-1-1-1]
MGPARRDGVKRRDELLDAALQCFTERGVLGTGIEEIRKAAGASPSSVYHLFDGLPDLTLALLLRTFERLFSHQTERVLATSTAEEAVLALVDGHLEWVLAHPDEGRFMYQAMAMELSAGAAEVLLARKMELLGPIIQHTARFIAEDGVPVWTPLQLDVVLLGPSHEACRRYLAGAALDPAWIRSRLPRLAWRSIQAELPRSS